MSSCLVGDREQEPRSLRRYRVSMSLLDNDTQDGERGVVQSDLIAKQTKERASVLLSL